MNTSAGTKRGKMDSQALKQTVDRLMSFAEVHMSEGEQIRVDVSINPSGLSKRLRIKWWLDYNESAWDDDSENDSDRRLLEGLPDQLPPTIVQNSRDKYYAGMKLWREKTRQLRAHLSPEYRLACVDVNSSFSNIQASVWPASPAAKTE